MSDFRVIEPGYCDLQTEAVKHLEERLYRRRRLLAGVRGCLREKTSPRWIIAWLLTQAGVAAVVFGWLLHACGVRSLPFIAASSCALACPVFLLLLRRRAGIDYHRVDKAISVDLSWYIARDEGAAAMENAPSSVVSPEVLRRRNAIADALSREGSKALGRAAGQIGIFGVIFLVAITAGGWLLWDLIRSSPDLLANMIVDAHLVPSHRGMDRRIESEPQSKEVRALVQLYFLILSVAALVIGWYVGELIKTSDRPYRMIPHSVYR